MAAEHQTEQVAYQNNPLLVATEGISLLFKRAYSVAIFAIIICSLAFLGQIAQTIVNLQDTFSHPQQSVEAKAPEQAAQEFNTMIANIDTSAWVLLAVGILLVAIGILVINTIVMGIADYTAAALARGKNVTLKQAFNGVMKQFAPYFVLRLLVSIKILLWSLLFIIPGIIMAVRYSLAGVSFFDKKHGPVAAVDDSIALTKNAWLTTYGSQTFLNMLSLGAIKFLLVPGTSAILYSQYRKGGTKPPAHILSWLALIIPIVFAAMFIVFMGFLLVILSAGFSNNID